MAEDLCIHVLSYTNGPPGENLMVAHKPESVSEILSLCSVTCMWLKRYPQTFTSSMEHKPSSHRNNHKESL